MTEIEKEDITDIKLLLFVIVIEIAVIAGCTLRIAYP